MKLPYKKRSDRLHQFLRTLSRSEVLYCPNPGNAGDSAIALATYECFKRLGVSYRCVEWDETFDARGNVLIYGGGGNLTFYPHARTFIHRHHAAAKRLVILPHTIRGHEDLLSQLGTDVDIFCREQRSAEWVRAHTSGPNVYLADDMAFGLDPASHLASEWMGGQSAALRLLIDLIRSAVKRAGVREQFGDARPLRDAGSFLGKGGTVLARRPHTLQAFRVDAERTGITLPPDNVDLSLIFDYGVGSPQLARRATVGMMSFLNAFDRVATNRLHVCVLAALLGKEVDFYSNSYFKNEAVYALSMRERFPNVRWQGAGTGSSHKPSRAFDPTFQTRRALGCR